MELHTQFTVPTKKVTDFNYVNKLEVLEKTSKKHLLYYPTQKDCLVYCD